MKTNRNIIVAIIFGVSSIFASDAKIGAKLAKLTDQSVKKSSINLTVESISDIYGVQFDIKYNHKELSLNENDIKSKVAGINIYSRVKEEGSARVLMFGMNGEKLLDVNVGSIAGIIDINFQPTVMFNGTSEVELVDVTIAGKGGEEISVSTSTFEVSFTTPLKTSLSKNYPNPFNPSTTIDYELSNAGMVSLVVYDLKGAVVKTLVQEHQEPNYHNAIWNGLNNNGQSVASGRYLLKMTAPGYTETIKMTLLK
ncbi:MAG: T9SS type A sorting domain-containing protein [Candidatus Marinimicrobia bacterium]|nr:T9SS type A sorting domain-containing protein [Candidatus Neomarinimicrobiota bacterium]